MYIVYIAVCMCIESVFLVRWGWDVILLGPRACFNWVGQGLRAYYCLMLKPVSLQWGEVGDVIPGGVTV